MTAPAPTTTTTKTTNTLYYYCEVCGYRGPHYFVRRQGKDEIYRCGNPKCQAQKGFTCH